MIKCPAIVGPTASGKTALSIALAEIFGGELIGCDSMQIYRGMDIGTAKATAEERRRAVHHLIDFLSPSEQYSAERYREDARLAAEDILSRGRLPIFVGGTGLYIDTLMRGASPLVPESSAEYRDAILAGIKSEEDVLALWERLREVDFESSEKIHKNNIKRVIRALEIFDKTGKPKSEFDRESLEARGDFELLLITLDFHNRDLLYSRIDKRVDMMVNDGLLAEVESLYSQGYLRGNDTSSAAIGYKEIVAYLEGKCSLAEAVDEIKLASRRYAKRQLTWYRHEKSAVTLFVDTEGGALRAGEDVAREATELVRNFLA